MSKADIQPFSRIRPDYPAPRPGVLDLEILAMPTRKQPSLTCTCAERPPDSPSISSWGTRSGGTRRGGLATAYRTPLTGNQGKGH